MAKSYIFLADGFEEVEAMATLDIMRRAQMEVETVSITGNPVVTGAHGVAVQADICISEISVEAADEAEWIVLPGGMPGATNLASCGRLGNMITSQFEHDRKIAAICASPAVSCLALSGYCADRMQPVIRRLKTIWKNVVPCMCHSLLFPLGIL